MSANIDKMMYVGEKPWHGLGTKLSKVATAAEAIKAAGLSWKVEKEPLYLKDDKVIPNRYAIVRQDTRVALTAGVREVYTPLQNKDAFSFFDAIVGIKEAIYHTAGSLGLGEKIWILAKLPGRIKVVKDDVVDKYLLLVNWHDGTHGVQVLWTGIRVVCENTLNLSINSRIKGETASVRHTALLGMRVSEVREQLGIINSKFQVFEEASKQLVKVQLKHQPLQTYFRNVLQIKGGGKDEELPTRTKNMLEQLSVLFEKGKGNDLPGVKGTAWAAFNSVVEHADYLRSTKGTGQEQQMRRAESLLFGSGSSLKQRAWDEAMKLAA